MNALTLACALWFTLMSGFFFAFSATVMPGFQISDHATGMIAMQRINEAVSNPFFAVGFWGALVLALVGMGAAGFTRIPHSGFLLAGCLVYFLGAFVVTAAGNVPMNRALDLLSAGDPEALAYWTQYQADWTRLNTIRMAASLFSALILLAPYVVARPIPQTLH